jgi:hypothetical protein
VNRNKFWFHLPAKCETSVDPFQPKWIDKKRYITWGTETGIWNGVPTISSHLVRIQSEKWECLKKKYGSEETKCTEEGRPHRNGIPCCETKSHTLNVDKRSSTRDALLPATGESCHCLLSVTRFIDCLWTIWVCWEGCPLVRWQMGHDCFHKGLWSILPPSYLHWSFSNLIPE